VRVAPLPDERFPAISDLARHAKKRMPAFAWEYVDSGTGEEAAVSRNLKAMARYTLVPRFMKGEIDPDTSCTIFGQEMSAPFGIAPIGYTSVTWPGAEQILARAAGKNRIPHCLSTVASDTPENCGPLSGDYGWFQLYPPRQEEIRTDIIDRAKNAGYKALAVTCDVPWPSMRERQRRAGLSIPPKISPKILASILARPEWAIKTLKRGKPNFAVLEKYVQTQGPTTINEFVAQQLGGILDWEYLKKVRDQWEGPLMLKGVLSVEDAKEALKIGVDGIWVSNHGGRQLEAAPGSIDALYSIAKALKGKATILFDSGVRGGNDIARALALGADFVFAGRPFLYGVAAIGEKGGDHVYTLLRTDLVNTMHQLGTERLLDLRQVEIQRDGEPLNL